MLFCDPTYLFLNAISRAAVRRMSKMPDTLPGWVESVWQWIFRGAGEQRFNGRVCSILPVQPSGGGEPMEGG